MPQVLEMYWGITAASLLALSTVLMGALVLEGVRDTLCRPTQATLSTMQQLANQVHTVEQKARIHTDCTHSVCIANWNGRSCRPVMAPSSCQ